MALPTVSPTDGVRARRWDAVVLGSGIPGLVTAARLGMAGQRVLVIEEDAAAAAFPGLREPFFLAGARDRGAVDASLRELTLSLIERRRIAEQDLAYQVLAPDLRMDVGPADWSAEELVAWGLSKPDAAHALTRALLEASQAERKAMLEASLVRIGRRMARGRGAAEGSHLRGLPAEVADAGPELESILAAQIRGLSNLADSVPSPEAQARLLGSVLAGGAGFDDGPPWLHGMLRRRVEGVFGEFRTLSRGFRLVSVLNQPGIAIPGSRELWIGRALVIAAPPTAVASQLEPREVPSFLPTKRKVRLRLAIHLRTQRSVLPEGLAERAILLDETRAPESAMTLACLPRENDPKGIELVARCLAQEGRSHEDQEEEMMQRVLAILPFSEGKLQRRPVKRASWDSEDWLEDPGSGACWPGEMDLRVNGKPPIYLLDRARVAGLGLEGDLLLGLRAGEALAEELG